MPITESGGSGASRATQPCGARWWCGPACAREPRRVPGGGRVPGRRHDGRRVHR